MHEITVISIYLANEKDIEALDKEDALKTSANHRFMFEVDLG